MKIRPFLPVDADAVRSLVFSSLEEHGLKPSADSTDKDLDDVEAFYAKGTFDVLENFEGELIGTVAVLPVREDLAELRKMYLHRDWRGRGLGHQLLVQGLKRAGELGMKSVYLETATPLKSAIALYKRCGFKPYEADHLSDRCDQAWILELDADD